MENTKWSYFAAIIDGEGHLGHPKNGLIISTTNQDLAKWLRRKVGGKLRFIKRGQNNWKDVWRWRISFREVIELSSNFERFLVIKRRRLEAWKEWYRLPKYGRRELAEFFNKGAKNNYPLNSGNPNGNPDPSPSIAETDAYLAGIIDGEGIIMIRVMDSNSHRGKQYLPLISITNCEEKLIDWLVENYEGSKVFVESRNPKHRDRWYWSCGAYLTRKVVKRIEKHAIVKAPHLKQIKKFLNLPRTNTPSKWWQRSMPIDKNGRWLTPHGYKRAEKIIKTISILNKKKSLLIRGEGRETIKGDNP